MKTIDVLIKNARIVDPVSGQIAPEDTGIAIDNGEILAVLPQRTLEMQYTGTQVLDAAGLYVFPGFVNTHNHLFQVLTKGLGKEVPLWQWLDGTIAKMTPHIDEQALYDAALAGCLASLRTGVTTTLDFQYLHSWPGHFDAVVQAFEDSGMRGYVGRVQYHDPYNGLSHTETESTAQYYSHLRALAAARKDRAMVDVAIVVPIIINMLELPIYHPGYLRGLREYAEDLQIPYTAHVVEAPHDDEYALRRTGLRTIPFMEQQQFFGPRCVLAHCVHMHHEDFAIFKQRDVKVAYNPVSNMVLASGTAPVQRFLDEGVGVSIATDGPGSNDCLDMLEALKIGSLLQKVTAGDARVMTAQTMLQLATVGGAAALCRDDIGQLQPGKKADLFFYNPNALRAAPVADPVASLVYASGESSIHTVVVNGRVLLQNGQFTAQNEERVVESLQKSAAKVRKAAGIDA